MPLLLFFGRFWGILKFFMTMFSHPTKTITLKTFDKALLTLEVRFCYMCIFQEFGTSVLKRGHSRIGGSLVKSLFSCICVNSVCLNCNLADSSTLTINCWLFARENGRYRADAPPHKKAKIYCLKSKTLRGPQIFSFETHRTLSSLAVVPPPHPHHWLHTAYWLYLILQTIRFLIKN